MVWQKLKKNDTDYREKHKLSYYWIISFSIIVLFYLCMFTRFTTDYGTHTNSMENMSIRPLLNPLNWISWFSEHGYPLWHICGHIIMRVWGCPANYAAGISSGLFIIISYIAVLKFLENTFRNRQVNENLLAILTFVLFIVGPVWLPWQKEYIILHNGGPNVWHNATNICGRAIGIIVFGYSLRLIEKIVDSNYEIKIPVKRYVLLSLLCLLSLIAKPSFVQSFVPAFGILLIYYLIRSRGKFKNYFGGFVAIAVVSGIKLLFQFSHYFSSNPEKAGIMTEKTGQGLIIEVPTIDTIVGLISNQGLILAFPIFMFTIMIIYKKIDKYHAMSIMMLLFLMIYVLTLKGSASGEMGWAYYIALFFVFMIGIRDYIYIFVDDKRILAHSYGGYLQLQQLY